MGGVWGGGWIVARSLGEKDEVALRGVRDIFGWANGGRS